MSCPNCQKQNYNQFFQLDPYQIVKCKTCTMVYVLPRPSEDELNKMYMNSSSDPFYMQKVGLDGENESYTIDLLLKNILRFKPKGELLEIGCGNGNLLLAAQKRGFRCTGIDLYTESPRLEHINIINTTLEKANFSQKFDVIVMRNTLEHLLEPLSTLNQINHLLNPGGVLYLKVPNTQYEYGWRSRLISGRAHAYCPPIHLNHFDPYTLEEMLSRGGFKIQEWLLEKPSVIENSIRNSAQQFGFHVIKLIHYMTNGRYFPKPILPCIAEKVSDRPAPNL